MIPAFIMLTWDNYILLAERTARTEQLASCREEGKTLAGPKQQPFRSRHIGQQEKYNEQEIEHAVNAGTFAYAVESVRHCLTESSLASSFLIMRARSVCKQLLTKTKCYLAMSNSPSFVPKAMIKSEMRSCQDAQLPLAFLLSCLRSQAAALI
jgi:hypothetical protein